MLGQAEEIEAEELLAVGALLEQVGHGFRRKVAFPDKGADGGRFGGVDHCRGARRAGHLMPAGWIDAARGLQHIQSFHDL